MRTSAKLLLGLALLVPLGVPAFAADLPTKAPPVPVGYPFNASGIYFGLGASALAGTPSAANTDLIGAGAALTGVVGYQWKGGLDFMAIEAAVDWTNYGTNGASCGTTSCSVASAFNFEERFKFGFPWQTVQALMPNLGNAFPSLPTISVTTTGTPHPYIFGGAVETDVSGNVAGFGSQVWQVQAEAGAGILQQINSGLVMDIWAGMTIPGAGFDIGPGGFASANLGKQFRAGVTFDY